MSTETVSHTNPEWEFCDRLRKVRRSIAEMTQEEMAQAIGVTQKVYATWESGRSKPTDIVAVAKKIAELWPNRVTPQWLLGVEGPPPGPPSHPSRLPYQGAQVLRLHEAATGRIPSNGPAGVDDDAARYVALAEESPLSDSNRRALAYLVPRRPALIVAPYDTADRAA